MENTDLRGFEKAATSVQGHLVRAVAAIDETFGEGFARANPQLVAAYLQSCALEDISVCLVEIGALVADGLRSAS